MEKSVDLEKVRLLAEQIIELKKEVAILNKDLKNEFDGVDVEVDEILSNGSRLTYKISKPKAKFDYISYAAFLFQALKKGEKYSEQELDEILEQFRVEKKEKWTLKITK
ncbi:hypothetical protein [Mycoplasma crocodyli]|uniref:hypothetical protein n=1 Tax=Mycoplasma crocodyli TaxID=50052 RepID=UPI0002DD2017|nr:hypothetical protein [Mycoplasma crocodyli]